MFQRNELQMKFLSLELSHRLIMIFRGLCHIEISCSTKWFNLQHRQINIYIPCSGTVLCPNKGKVKLDIFKTILKKNKTNMKMLWTGIRSIVNVKVKTQFSNISHLLDG